MIIAAAFICTQLFKCLDTVLIRHQMIHQDQVIALCPAFLQTLYTIFRGIDLHLRLFEQ